MNDIFLSYKSEDRPKARIIADALEQKGYSVWWDRIIPPGRRFSAVIQEELDASKCVIVLWSKESVKSEWVETEASEGNRRRILIPVMIDQVQPPLAFRMIEAAKLMDWDGTLEHEEFDLLLGSIGRILGQNCAAGTEDKTPHIALEIDPQYQQALNDKGMDFYNLGSYQEALDAFDKALKNNPLDKLLWYNKGSALGNLGRYQEAISAYDKALKIDPQFKQAWYNKGGALGNLGNYQEALVASDKALKIG